jgi:hypothetical protein
MYYLAHGCARQTYSSLYENSCTALLDDGTDNGSDSDDTLESNKLFILIHNKAQLDITQNVSNVCFLLISLSLLFLLLFAVLFVSASGLSVNHLAHDFFLKMIYGIE